MRPSDSRSLSAIATNTSILVNRKPPTPKEVSNIWDHYMEFLRKRERFTDPIMAHLEAQAECDHDMSGRHRSCTKCNIKLLDFHEQRQHGRGWWLDTEIRRYRISKENQSRQDRDIADV